MKEVFENIIDTIGNTPVVRCQRAVPNGPHSFFAKLESFNPGNSVKDRLGLALINDAEKRGVLKPGGTIVEATSGNTGMGLAMVAAVRGYKSIFVMPEKISEEKRAILRAYGAEVVITPTGVEPDDPRSHYSVAKKIADETPNSFYANQYHNPANAKIHYQTTGPEIWRQMEGKIDVLVAGIGTGGTLSGIGRYLKEKNPNVKIVCADPVGSILHDLYYYKEVRTPPTPYKVEGVGEDMLPENVHFDVIDAVVQFDDREAFLKTRELTAQEGICVGPSSGGALAAAIKYAQNLKSPANILVIMPDNGRAYLSKTYNMKWLVENGIIDKEE